MRAKQEAVWRLSGDTQVKYGFELTQDAENQEVCEYNNATTVCSSLLDAKYVVWV